MTTSPKKERSSATKTRRRRSLRRELRRSLTPWSTPGPSGSIALPQSPPSPSRRIGAALSARSTPSLPSRSSGEQIWPFFGGGRTLAGRRKKPRTHRRALREEEETGLSKSHGLGSASLRTFKEASSPHESLLVPLNLVPSPIKHWTVVQSSPVPPKEVKQTPPKGFETFGVPHQETLKVH
ncbi:unnamed protein product [Malus baccata var. baccata]